MAEPKQLTILHFNDIYDIDARGTEPVGGAARMASKLKSYGPKALITFGGDAYNPSILSTMTQGEQMTAIMNECGVHVAGAGNHDLDHGLAVFQERSAECKFPWLLANLIDKTTGLPLGGCKPSLLMEHDGIKLGFIGLAEEDVILTLGTVDPATVQYIDFVEEAERLSKELRAQGAELVIALTHMRVDNDVLLARKAPGVDLVLGGHDHDFFLLTTEPIGTAVVKSGTDFRDLSEVRITLGGAAPSADVAAAAAAAAAASFAAGDKAVPDAPSLVAARVASSRQHLVVQCRRCPITSDIPEDPATAEIVKLFNKKMGTRMDVVVGYSAVDLDGRFATVRTGESNLGNWVADLHRQACRTDIAIINGGCLRSDRIHAAGPLTHRDLLRVMPLLDDSAKLEISGAQLVEALENGVHDYPEHEGRFPQVSGIRFAFDPRKPRGQRIVPGSVVVGEEPVQAEKLYTMATKAYIAGGKDGYDVLAQCRRLGDDDCIPQVATTVNNHLLLLKTLNWAIGATNRVPLWRIAAAKFLRFSPTHKRLAQQRLAAERVSRTAWQHPVTGRWEIAPVLEGRIRNLELEGVA